MSSGPAATLLQAGRPDGPVPNAPSIPKLESPFMWHDLETYVKDIHGFAQKSLEALTGLKGEQEIQQPGKLPTVSLGSLLDQRKSNVDYMKGLFSQMHQDLLEEIKTSMKVALEEQRSMTAGLQSQSMTKIGPGVVNGVAPVALNDSEIIKLEPATPDQAQETSAPIYPSHEHEHQAHEHHHLRLETEVIEEAENEGVASPSAPCGRGSTWIAEQDMDGALVSKSVKALQKDVGICHRIVESHIFHSITLSIITLNAIYIGIDADFNDAESLGASAWGFQFCEHTFCVFFVCELMIRFGAFRDSKGVLSDRQFLFDLLLVVLMVVDTWVFSIILSAVVDDVPNTGSVGGIGRLFRLLRLARITRLMNMVPELRLIIKSMVAAVRAVHAALLILVLLVYVFAIALNSLLGDEDEVSAYYSSVGTSMVTLFLSGVLLDNISDLVNAMIDLRAVVALAAFALFLLLSAVTVMNMVIGVLCEVVLDVSSYEKEEQIKQQMSTTLLVMLENLDDDHSGQLSKSEMTDVIREPAAVAVLKDIQVDTQHLLDVFDMLYEQEDTTLPIPVIMNIVLTLRGQRPATMNDLAKEQNFMVWAMESQLEQHRALVTSRLDSLQESLNCRNYGNLA